MTRIEKHIENIDLWSSLVLDLPLDAIPRYLIGLLEHEETPENPGSPFDDILFGIFVQGYVHRMRKKP